MILGRCRYCDKPLEQNLKGRDKEFCDRQCSNAYADEQAVCQACEGTGTETSADGLHERLCAICSGSGNLNEIRDRDGNLALNPASVTPSNDPDEEPPWL